MEVYLHFCENHYYEFQRIMKLQGHPVATGGKLTISDKGLYGAPCCANSNDHTDHNPFSTHYVSFFTEDIIKR